MASLNLAGKNAGYVKLTAPDDSSNNPTVTLPTESGELALKSERLSGYRNLIINGDMRIAQRGTSAVTTNFSFPVDRWTMLNSGGTFTAQQQTFTLGDAPDSRLQNYVRLTRSSPSGSLYFTHKIEDVINSNDVTVTVSFYAKANTDITLPVRLVQVFGSGGSTAVTVDSVNNSVTSSWQRFTATFICPSLSGKTIGTSSYLELTFDTPASYSTLDITGVQLEVSDTGTATPFEHQPYDVQLQRCKRYYQKIKHLYGSNPVRFYSASTSSVYVDAMTFPVEMRNAPTATEEVAPSVAGVSTGILSVRTTADSVGIAGSVTGAGWYHCDRFIYSYDAEV